MSEDYLAQQQPTQTWNTARGVWEKQGIANLLCEHWELFSETWQTSGTMRNGKVYELPTLGPRITDSECSSSPILRTPAASEAERGHQPEDKSKARGGQVTLSGQMMTYFPTPKARDSQAEGYEAGLRRATPQVGTIVKGLVEGDARVLMPTPNTMDHLPARTPEQKELNKGKGGYANVRETVVNDLLPTPVAAEGLKAPAQQDAETKVKTGQVWLSNEAKGMHNRSNWGKFEPAIRRWEKTLGRPAPLPTKPDGKDGAHRLSSAFTEWMMGLPEGWVTGVGLTRNEELKACGNGVVPQQAELALRILLEGVTLPAGGGK